MRLLPFYSGHYYDFKAKSADDQQKAIDGTLAGIARLQQARAVPFYLGEFGLEPHGTPAQVAGLVDALGRKGAAWSLWTYKVIFPGGGHSLWGLYENARPVTPLDPYRDTEAAWVRKCAPLRTENLDENAALAQELQSAVRPPQFHGTPAFK